MSSNDKINDRNYWISDNGEQALWYVPKFNYWIIGIKKYLGSTTIGMYSKSDAPCPNAVGNKWKFWDGGKWLDAGNDAQAVCKIDGEQIAEYR